MLNADEAGAWVEHHFDTVTDAEFIANVRRFSPDLAQELWGISPWKRSSPGAVAPSAGRSIG